MGHPHLDGPDMPQIFFVAFDLLAIASIGIALQNKCFRKIWGGGRYNFRGGGGGGGARRCENICGMSGPSKCG